MKKLFAVLVCALLVLSCNQREGDRDRIKLTLAVAANVAPTVEKLALEYERAHPVKIVVSSGASGLLMRQAQQGAPFDLFISADMARVEQLAREGIVVPDSVAPYAVGQLVVIMGPLHEPGTIMENWGIENVSGRVAIANPETAPYGKAAVEALKSLGRWEELKGGVIYTDGVQQALQYVESGDVNAAFVPLSLALRFDGHCYRPIDSSHHAPILQGLGLMADAREPAAAEEFRRYLLSAEASRAFSQAGYLPPAAVSE